MAERGMQLAATLARLVLMRHIILMLVVDHGFIVISHSHNLLTSHRRNTEPKMTQEEAQQQQKVGYWQEASA